LVLPPKGEEQMKKNLISGLEIQTYQITPPSPNQLVDRKEQLDKFNDVLDRIKRQGPISSNLFEWYGSPGIGKSMLVTMLERQAEAKNASWALVNFKKSSTKIKLYLQDPVLLIEELTTGLRRNTSLNADDFNRQIKAYRAASLPTEGVVSAYEKMDQETRLFNRPDWLDGLRNVVIEFIKLVNTLPEQEKSAFIRPVIVFFDETEYADIMLVDWIEEWIINPLLQIKHCMVVWTARRPWRWKRPEIRRRLTSEELNVFEPEMVKAQIQSGSAQPDLVEELFKNVYTLTGGHPFASYIVINELDSLAKDGKEVTPKTFAGFESQLLEEVFSKFINGYAFSELGSQDLKIACKYIALVRLFDSTMLREILSVCVGEPFKSWTQEDFGDLILQLKKTQLLVWEKGYSIDSGLRHIIEKYFMVSERKTFINANQAALNVYEDWLKRPVDNRGLFVVEELYHNAILSQVGKKKNLNTILDKRLKEYPKWIKDKQALDNALERLENEIKYDKELDQYTNIDLGKKVQKFRETKSPLGKRSKK